MSNMRDQIEKKLVDEFSPDYVDVKDESYMHASGPQAQSHFKVTLVSEAFDGLRLIQRHRAVNAVLAEELRDQIHALALHTYTPLEWKEKFGQVPSSPACRGGSKEDSAASN
ncbi:BolA family protein [Aliidiomarina indica]|uniref:BolA family protein n=1 Tax=Aliidiomarina indica TaxID=2749147 RepID=UPI00188E454F|nr:BolA/IbaG family iron-sulfur metabolism protein [Aliidiomarina indica]